MKTREKHTGLLLAAAALATAFTCTAFTVSAAEEQEMRTVETDKGEVEIPVNPEKNRVRLLSWRISCSRCKAGYRVSLLLIQ